MLWPDLRDDTIPFAVGRVDPADEFIHLLDDTTLDILLSTRDTITDFVEYLTAKEKCIASGRLGAVAGEEELLACYLKNLDEDGNHAFVFPPDASAVTILEGCWDEFFQSPERRAQLAADRVSYGWDVLIEQFTKHLLGGTQYYASHTKISEQEQGLRIMAREPRLIRRMLAASLFDLLEATLPTIRATRIVAPLTPTSPHYVFLLLPHHSGVPEADYREVRRKLLEQYCRVVKFDRPAAQDIVGIAMAPHTGSGNSEDFLHFDARYWTTELIDETRTLKQELIRHGLLGEQTYWEAHGREFPTPERPGLVRHTMRPARPKGRDRNAPCPCGSGKKFNKCCANR